MERYIKQFKENSLFINNNDDIEVSDENLNVGIKISLGKGKFIPYHSSFSY